jgi:hypothetical protein
MDDKQPTPEQQKQIRKAKWTLWLGIFIIVFVGLAVAVYFLFVKSAGEQGNVSIEVNTNKVIDTSDWTTYSNAQYGFQFQYPKDWQLNELANHCPYDELNDDCANDIVILNPSSEVSIYVSHQGKNLEHLTVEEWLIQNQRKQYDEKYKIKTSDIGKITLSDLTPGLYQGVVSIDFTEGDDVFEIEWYDVDKNNEQEFLKFQQFVLSIEFASTTSIDTNNWLTHENEEQGYSIRIPNDWIVEEIDNDGVGENFNFAGPLRYTIFYDADKKYKLTLGVCNEGEDYVLTNRILFYADSDNGYYEYGDNITLDNVDLKTVEFIYNGILDGWYLGDYASIGEIENNNWVKINGKNLYSDLISREYQGDLSDILEIIRKIISSLQFTTSVSEDSQTESVEKTRTYTSENSGITFQYAPNDGYRDYLVEEKDDKIILYNEDNLDLPIEQTGQYIQKFNKDASDSLETAIEKEILAGYDLNKCLIEDMDLINSREIMDSNGWKAVIIRYEINLDSENYWENYKDCPEVYPAMGGIAYFIENEDNSNNFYFLKIGQYSILSNSIFYKMIENNNYNGITTWDATIRFIDE